MIPQGQVATGPRDPWPLHWWSGLLCFWRIFMFKRGGPCIVAKRQQGLWIQRCPFFMVHHCFWTEMRAFLSTQRACPFCRFTQALPLRCSPLDVGTFIHYFQRFTQSIMCGIKFGKMRISMALAWIPLLHLVSRMRTWWGGSAVWAGAWTFEGWCAEPWNDTSWPPTRCGRRRRSLYDRKLEKKIREGRGRGSNWHDLPSSALRNQSLYWRMKHIEFTKTGFLSEEPGNYSEPKKKKVLEGEGIYIYIYTPTYGFPISLALEDPDPRSTWRSSGWISSSRNPPGRRSVGGWWSPGRNRVPWTLGRTPGRNWTKKKKKHISVRNHWNHRFLNRDICYSNPRDFLCDDW